MSKETRRIAVIGDAQVSQAEGFPWNDRALPNVTDYDVAILDLRVLAQDYSGMTCEGLRDFQALLRRLFESEGQVIAIAENPQAHIALPMRNGRGPVRLPVTAVFPVAVTVTSESGQTLNRLSDKFSRYLNHVKSWKFHFKFGDVGTVERYLQNREEKWLAAELRREAGRVVLLPNGEFSDPRDAISFVLEEITGAPAVTAPPAWSGAIEIPGISALEAEARGAQEEIRRLSEHVATLAARQGKLEEYRRLVYGTGKELEDIVARSFELLGGTIIPRKYGTEEYILVYRDREHLIEVKGVTGSSALDHVRQLFDNQSIAEQQTDTSPHCILVANTFRNDPPENRGAAPRIEFPDNVVRRATANDIALLSTVTLLDAVCAKLAGAPEADAFLDRLTATAGICAAQSQGVGGTC
jgi:hypothetical protein